MAHHRIPSIPPTPDPPPPPGQHSRTGKVAVNAYVPPDVRDAFKHLAIKQRKTQQALFLEAMDDLFAKHGYPRVATPEPRPEPPPAPEPTPAPAPEFGQRPEWILRSQGIAPERPIPATDSPPMDLHRSGDVREGAGPARRTPDPAREPGKGSTTGTPASRRGHR